MTSALPPPLFLQSVLIVAPSLEVSHEHEHPEERNDECGEDGILAERVVEAVEQCRNGKCEEIQRLAIPRVKIGESHEIPGDGTPNGVEKRQAGQPCNIAVEGRCVVELSIESDLVLHPFEDAEGYTRHQTVEHQCSRVKRFFRPPVDDEQRHHFPKLLRESHPEHKAQHVDGERSLGERIERVEPDQSEDIPHEEDEELSEEEYGNGGFQCHLRGFEEIVEEQSPDAREIEGHDIKYPDFRHGQQEHQCREQSDECKHEQGLVVHPLSLGQRILRKNEVGADFPELF